MGCGQSLERNFVHDEKHKGAETITEQSDEIFSDNKTVIPRSTSVFGRVLMGSKYVKLAFKKMEAENKLQLQNIRDKHSHELKALEDERADTRAKISKLHATALANASQTHSHELTKQEKAHKTEKSFLLQKNTEEIARAVAAAAISEQNLQNQAAYTTNLELKLDDATLEVSKLTSKLTAQTIELTNQTTTHQDKIRHILQKTAEDMACAVAAATVVSEEIVQAQFARMRSLKLQLDDVTLEASKLKAELTTQQAAHTMEILNQANAHQEERRILLQKTKEMAHATAAAAAATEKTLRNQLLHWNLMANMTTTVNGSLEQKLVDATFTASCLREKVEGLQLSGFELLQELEEVKEQAPFPSPTRFKVGTLLPDLLKTLDSKTEYKNQFSPTGVNLGEGGFSKVVEVTQISTGRLCAVKTLDARKKARTFMELFATFQLRHDNLVETLGIFLTNRNEVSVVMPRMVLSLDHLVDERPLAHHLTAFVVSQVARALRYIHGMDMAHKDVKPANILIGNDGSVKLADFGLVEVVYLGTALYDTNGTSGFMAPEQLRGAGHDQLSDIWSLGVSTFHCLNGSNYVDAEECVVQLLIDGVRGVPANYGSPEISKYFDGVLELNPKERWTAADVMECDFITTVARDAQEEFLAYVLLAV